MLWPYIGIVNWIDQQTPPPFASRKSRQGAGLCRGDGRLSELSEALRGRRVPADDGAKNPFLAARAVIGSWGRGGRRLSSLAGSQVP